MNERVLLADLRLPVSEETPSGGNLEYDIRFQDLARMSEGTREQQYGATIIAAKPPEWKLIQPLVDELCGETRDLRVGVVLVESATHFGGFPACAESLDVLRGWVCDFWDSVHPELDPEDHNDPFIRINALSRLCEEHRLPKQLLSLPLAECQPHTRVTLADVEAARNHSSKSSSDATRLTSMEIDAAFMGADLGQLRATYEACQRAYQSVGAMTQFLDQQPGDTSWDAGLLRRRLRECGEVIKHHLRLRMNAADSALAQTENLGSPVRRRLGQEQWPADFDGTGGSHEILEIVSREHAAELIQLVVEFFEQNEPSSPVPLLLRRSKRLINQGFAEILRDVAPDGLNQLQTLAGDFEDS